MKPRFVSTVSYAIAAILAAVSFSGVARAQSKSMSAEALGAKAFLEDLLVRRYSQELATKVERDSFTLGAQLDLTFTPTQVIPPTQQEQEPISDLMLGTLDPEELIKKYAGGNTPASAQGFLSNYKVKTVGLSVGLKENVPADVKAEVEKWLSERLKSEFGSAGKGKVTVIKTSPVQEKKQSVPPPANLWDWLERFQSLAGQIALAVGLIVGALTWALFGGGSKKAASQSGDGAGVTINNQPGGREGESAEETKQRLAFEKIEKEKVSTEIAHLTQRLNDIVPRIGPQMENVLRSWCQMGEPGRLKLACFAEAVGRDMGKLPIPVDAMNDVSKVFAKMTEVAPKEKKDALEKAYWDLLTAMNLGAEVLNQPFGYLGGVKVDVVSQVLMDQNPRMKTLVSLFLPKELRNKYVKSLSTDAKKELLESAASMSEVDAAELRSLDGSIAKKMKGNSDSKDTVPLEMTLNKMVAALTILEEINLLGGMSGRAIAEFKRATASLAFLAEWPDEKLSILLARTTADELVAFLRVRPDLQERFLRLSPPFTAEMASDELKREDKMSESDRSAWLESFARRLKEMVQLQEISLEEIFPVSQADGNGANEGIRLVA